MSGVFGYEMPPVGSAGRGGVTVGASILAGTLQSLRGANGACAAKVRNALPTEFEVVDDGHVDSGTGCAPTSSVVEPVMTADDAAVRLKLTVNTTVRAELGEVANFLAEHPEASVGVGRSGRRRHDTKRVSSFGEVTIPIGGPGAAIVTDPATGIPRACMHFHGRRKKTCTAGVPVGHPSGKAGQCMYKH